MAGRFEPTGRQRQGTTSGKSILCSPLVHGFVIAILGVIVYSNSFNAPFVLDDIRNIVKNPVIRDFGAFLDPSKIDDYYVGRPHSTDWRYPLKTRTVGYIALALNFALHGLDVRGYHLFNLVIHILNSLLVYSLVLVTFRTPRLSDSGTKFPKGDQNISRPQGIALLSSLIFLCHPVQTQAVTYIIQRFTSLAAMFCLLSLTAYARSRSSASSSRRRIFYGISLGSAVLAMKTKEIAFILPILIGIYDFMFLEGKMRERILRLIPFLATMLIIPLAILPALAPAGRLISDLDAATHETADIGRLDYLFTQFRVIVTYIRLLILPVNQNVDYDYPIFRSLTNPQVFLSLLFLIMLVSCAVFFAFKGRRQGKGTFLLVAFGVFWFLIALSVESSVIPIRDVIFEHRVYLPSIGFIIAAVTSATMLKDKISPFFPAAPRTFIVAASAAILLLSAATYTRNGIWGDEAGLWKDTIRKSPRKPRPYNSLGIAYDKMGFPDEAIRAYQEALRLKPDYFDAHNNLGLVYIKLGRMEEGTRELKAAFAKGHYEMGVTLKGAGRYQDAVREFRKAIDGMPYFAAAHREIGLIYVEAGRFEDAIEAFLEVVRLQPVDPEGYSLLGKAYASSGRKEDAVRAFQAALSLDPESKDAERNLDMATRSIGSR